MSFRERLRERTAANDPLLNLFLLTMAAFTYALTVADAWTTYMCLTTSVPGWEVTEANPFSDRLFQAMEFSRASYSMD